MRAHLTEKADVALEILSGRPNSDNTLENDKVYLLEWVIRRKSFRFAVLLFKYLLNFEGFTQ